MGEMGQSEETMSWGIKVSGKFPLKIEDLKSKSM